jgi:hypothetical protein
MAKRIEADHLVRLVDNCSLHQEGADESGSFEVDGEVWITDTPTR